MDWDVALRRTRDVTLMLVGVFMLVRETLATTPNFYLVSAGLAALGLPTTMLLDRRNGNGKK